MTDRITTITLGSAPIKYESDVNLLRKKTPDTIKKTILVYVNNASTADIRIKDTNILSLKLLGFIDKNATSPPALDFVEFTTFWEGGMCMKTAQGTGTVRYNGVLITGMDNLLTQPITLSSWAYGNGTLTSGVIQFRKVSDASLVNLTGILFFEIEQSAWV